MPVTLTIKQVPDKLAAQLRLRAKASHRSLQGELMAIISAAVTEPGRVAAPDAPAYVASAKSGGKTITKGDLAFHGPKLTLAQAWDLSRKLGPPSKDESTAIIRTARDGRFGR